MKTRNIIIHFTLYFIIFACISCAQPVEDESHDDDITRLTIVSTSPANLSGNNPIDTAISITFNVPVVQTGWTITINGIDHSVSDGSFNTAGTILTIVPKVTFTWGDIANVALAGFVSDDARMMALSPEFTSFSFAIGPIVSGIIAIAGDQKVTLSWDPAANATSYNIYWSNTNGVTKYNGTKITSASNPYIHNSLTNGITYYYVITAMNAGNESVESSQVSVKPLLNPVPGNSGTITTGSVTYNSLLVNHAPPKGGGFSSG